MVKLTTKQKTKIIAGLLKERGYTASSKDCNIKNYKKYAEILISDFYKCVATINIETKKININKKIFDLAMKIEAMLISANVINYRETKRMQRVKRSVDFFLSHNGILEDKEFYNQFR